MGFAITDDLTKKAIPADKLGPNIVHTVEFTFISAEENASEKIVEALRKGTLNLSDATPASALNELSAIAPERVVASSTETAEISDTSWLTSNYLRETLVAEGLKAGIDPSEEEKLLTAPRLKNAVAAKLRKHMVETGVKPDREKKQK
ncbi:hypothetical protein [Gordonia sputi]|uniref:hypothetical protein n=1 Tax=Gordonia sputi TaxID=36823 RepID=UPI003684AC09